MAIKDLPEASRPRERMERLGVAALTDAELVAIILRTGVRGQTALMLAENLLTQFGGIRGLVSAPPSHWNNMRGLGKVKRGQLLAGIELARRMMRESLNTQPAIRSSLDVADYLRVTLAPHSNEVFMALWLDSKHYLVRDVTIAQGTINEAMVYPREVVKSAIAHHASAVIFAHNHPSGHDPSPSPADVRITKKLINALRTIDVRVLDHMIVAGNKVCSMADRGYDFELAWEDGRQETGDRRQLK